MKKSDLENGTIVQYREGILRMVIEECLVGLDGHNDKFTFTEDSVLGYKQIRKMEEK